MPPQFFFWPWALWPWLVWSTSWCTWAATTGAGAAMDRSVTSAEIHSLSLRRLLDGVKGLVEGGHPNVPALLRLIANDIEAGKGITVTAKSIN